MKNKQRTKDFINNSRLDSIISELTEFLFPVQKMLQEKYNQNKYPFLFILGCPRSGSTLLLQWLASLGVFSYPTNVLNRFAYAPYIGAQVQKMLFDSRFDHNGEFVDLNSNISFLSNLGKSNGALSINEFQYFFRNYMHNFVPRYLTDKEVERVDFDGIKKGLISIEEAFQKPFVTKNVMLQFNLESLYSQIPKSFFLYIKRDPIYNMQSLILAREKYYGNRNIWWSVKPKEYNKLKELDVYHQVAGQVYYTEKAISEGLQQVPEEKKIIIYYEEFCAHPTEYYKRIIKKLSVNGYTIDTPYVGKDEFSMSNSIKLSKDEIIEIKRAYAYFSR